MVIPREMARRTISSSVFLAWPGQNSPEWECIENAMVGAVSWVFDAKGSA